MDVVTLLVSIFLIVDFTFGLNKENADVEQTLRCTERWETITITADNELRLYIDGRYVLHHADWTTRRSYTYKDSRRQLTLAVKATNHGSIAGLIAEFKHCGQQLGTNGNWKCTNTYHSNWFGPSYDDRHWRNAIILSDNPAHNNRNYADFSAVAKTIWTHAESIANEVIYCRRSFPSTGKSGTMFALSGQTISLPCEVPFPTTKVVEWRNQEQWHPSSRPLYTNQNNPNNETIDQSRYEMDLGPFHNMKVKAAVGMGFLRCVLRDPPRIPEYQPNWWDFGILRGPNCKNGTRVDTRVGARVQLVCDYEEGRQTGTSMAWYDGETKLDSRRGSIGGRDRVHYYETLDLVINNQHNNKIFMCTSILQRTSAGDLSSYESVSCFVAIFVI